MPGTYSSNKAKATFWPTGFPKFTYLRKQKRASLLKRIPRLVEVGCCERAGLFEKILIIANIELERCNYKIQLQKKLPNFTWETRVSSFIFPRHAMVSAGSCRRGRVSSLFLKKDWICISADLCLKTTEWVLLYSKTCAWSYNNVVWHCSRYYAIQHMSWDTRRTRMTGNLLAESVS